MARYRVDVPEVWIQTVVVEASSEKDALDKANRGHVEGSRLTFYYSHNLDAEDAHLMEDPDGPEEKKK